MDQVASARSTLVILDQNDTAHGELGELPYSLFEQGKSGAVLTGEWAHGTPVPWFREFLQDKDLHPWYLPESREINRRTRPIPLTLPCRVDSIRVT